jgi:hypothetical protein
MSHADFSSFNYDIITVDLSGVYLYGSVPFYHDDPVNGGAFLGFTGQTYHTKNGIKAGSEYRTSIYRGYLFTGPYLGMTVFKGMGFDLSGTQTGFCGGIAGHYILFDQFEFSVYFGRDYLVSTNKSGVNLSFSLEKKM